MSGQLLSYKPSRFKSDVILVCFKSHQAFSGGKNHRAASNSKTNRFDCSFFTFWLLQCLIGTVHFLENHIIGSSYWALLALHAEDSPL